MDLRAISFAIVVVIIATAIIILEIKRKQDLLAQSRQEIPKSISAKSSPTQQSTQVKNQCPSCQKPIEWNDAHFCSACGTDLKPQCSQCHIPLRAGDAFCYKCGQSVAKNTPPILSAVSHSSISTTVISSTHCPHCNAAITTQDTFCGSCGKSLITNTDQTMQK